MVFLILGSIISNLFNSYQKARKSFLNIWVMSSDYQRVKLGFS